MSVYILSHKMFEQPEDSFYKSILLGAYKGHIFGDYYDDEGDNISIKNPSYCELTGIYWVWKNVSDDIVGFVHYRRFFSKSIGNRKYLTENDIRKKLSDTDIILPNMVEIYKTVGEQFLNSFEPTVLNQISVSVHKVSPDYYATYKKVINGNRIYFCNIMICRKELLDSYCSWLFPILEDLEKNLDTMSFNDYQKRIFGFVSERLLTVWVLHNRFKVSEVGVVNIESKDGKFIDILNGLRRVYSYYFKPNRIIDSLIKRARNIKYKIKIRKNC